MKVMKKMRGRARLLQRLCALAMSISMLVVLAVPAFAETENETVYKLDYILNQKTFGDEDYYDMVNTATDSIYTVSGSSAEAITDYTYEAGFKIKLSNPGKASQLQIQLMGSTTSVNLLNNVKFIAYDSHEYDYRLLRSSTLLADRDDGLVTDGETWNDIRFVIRETPSDGDPATTTDDTVSYDVYINGKFISTQSEIKADGLNGEQAAKRDPYQFRFKHDNNAGNSILIDDVWIAKYVPYEPITTQKLVYTMDNKSFSGADNYDMNDTETGSYYELAVKSANAITDLDYEAGFKIKLSNPGKASQLQIQLMGSASANILNNVKFVAYDDHDYAYRLLRSNTVLTDKTEGLVTDGETWNDIRFVIRETPSDGDTTTTTDDTVSYDVYVNGALVATQKNIAVSGLNGTDAAKRNPYKWRFKHDTNAGNSILIDDVWIAKYVPSGIGWEFDDAVELKNYWKSDSTNYSVSDSALKYTAHVEYEEAALAYTPATAIDNSIYGGLKVKMKHSGEAAGSMKLYLTGTATVDGAEVPFDYTTGAITVNLKEAGSDFVQYELPLNETLGELSLADATIASMKLVPMDTAGNFEIDSIWIVDNLIAPLNASKMSLNYEFKDEEKATAMGTISLDFGGQRSYNASNVDLLWAYGNDTDGYTVLDNYTRITYLTGPQAEEGYTITKYMIVPETANALVARVADVEKTFDVVYKLPDSKLPEEKEPSFVIALTSDYHFGDPNYQTHKPSDKMLKARKLINETADAVIVSGDIIDTFGGRSWYTVRGMNGLPGYGYRIDPATEEDDEVTLVYYETEIVTDENGESKKVLTDTPTGKVATVENTDCYDMAYDYFTGFDIPVYLVEGNHESPEAAYLDYVGVSPQRTKRLLTRYIDWSVANGKYPDPIERNIELYDNWYEESINYDDFITDGNGNEYHTIFLRNFGSDRPVKWLTEDELDWLDQKLYENESTGKPIFLVHHIMPVRNKVGKMESYGYFGLNFPAFEKIINKHPSVVVVSGHTHQSQDQDKESYYDGKEEEPSFINVPAMKHSWINGSELSGDYAMFVYAEMYEDRIITRAFETATEKNPARGLGQITRKPVPTHMGSLSVTRAENADGTYTLTASCADENATYEWILKGETKTGKSIVLETDHEGFIAVRATDAEGNYISDSFDGLYDRELMGAEERTYFAVAGQANGLNPLTDAEGDAAVWANGVGGKNTLDEAAQLDSQHTYYQLKNVWTKQNQNSEYLTMSFDAMPANDNSKSFFVASNDTQLSADVSDVLETNKWNNIAVVCNIANGEVKTYVNGALFDTTSANLSEESSLVFGIEATDVIGYIDNLIVYETVAEPLFSKRIEKSFAEKDGTTLYSAEKKTLYLPDGTLCSDITKQMNCVVVSADGSTKTSNSTVSDGDFAVYHDANSRQYVYYDIVLYSDYDRLQLEGSISGEDIVLYVNAKTAGDTVVVAYYDSEKNFVGCEFAEATAVGLNKISLNIIENAHSAKIMVWMDADSINPLAEVLTVE